LVTRASVDLAVTDTAGAKTIASLARGPQTVADSHPFALASDHPAIPVLMGGTAIESSVTFQRPADNTGYTVGDIVGTSATAGSNTAMVFPNCARAAGGWGKITRAALWVRNTTPALMTPWNGASMRLFLFLANPYATAPTVGDNGNFDGGAGGTGAIADDNDYVIGSIDFLLGDQNGRFVNKRVGWSAPDLTDIQFKLPSAGGNNPTGLALYGVLSTLSAIATPGASSTFGCKLEITALS
jgi:hypothetical protein